METFEFEGRTTEEAIENAHSQLEVNRDEMDIEVLEPGSAGIFGLVGGRKARIKVNIPTDDASGIPKENDGLAIAKENDGLAIPKENDGLGIAKDALERILSLIPVEEFTVKAEQIDGKITLNIEGDRSGLLIGRKGRTLDALQFIVNKIVNKSLEKRTQVVVDSENYRQRRKDFLVQMALKMGDKAKKTRKPVATAFLDPQERRIVHLALREDENLETKSRGEGVIKKIAIIPKK